MTNKVDKGSGNLPTIDGPDIKHSLFLRPVNSNELISIISNLKNSASTEYRLIYLKNSIFTS